MNKVKKRITHQVAIPENWNERVEKLKEPELKAKSYPFELDQFQKLAISSIEMKQSVLVSAHTSAGKTAIAEYAIAQSLKANQRVIYTSPIKALSNQKYREFQKEFNDVGLITGDVSINQNASCLIMTTEILRNMLYRATDIIREVSWVIFDEIHYMRDKERGVVWEESIILLPSNTRFVFLSATIPNAEEFAGWIAKLHNQPCHVVYTDFRPVPLIHYYFSNNKLFLVMDQDEKFKEKNAEDAIRSFTLSKENNYKQKRRRVFNIFEDNICNLTMHLFEKNQHPMIVFSFSRNECDKYANAISNLNFTNENEKKHINQGFYAAISGLAEEDKNLNQVEFIKDLLIKGIGVHHSGILPILKEITEIFFQGGLVKILFATETFSMGLNMPTKTVIFTSIRKFDGYNFRYITSGEYIQMSGRAGRRGLDSKGTVITIVNDFFKLYKCKKITKGLPDPLISAFYLSYNTILNMLRVNDGNPFKIIDKSFFWYQNEMAINKILKLSHGSTKEDSSDFNFIIDNQKILSEYCNISNELFSMLILNSNISSLIKPGALVYVKEDDSIYFWALIDEEHSDINNYYEKKKLNVFILNTSSSDRLIKSLNSSIIELESIVGFSKYYFLPCKRFSFVSKKFSIDMLKRLIHLFLKKKNDLFTLAPLDDLIRKVNPESLNDKISKLYNNYQKINEKIINNSRFHGKSYLVIEKKLNLYLESINIKSKSNNPIIVNREKLNQEHIINMEKRTEILETLGYCKEGVITSKGHIASEISIGNELVLCEMIVQGIFMDLDPAETAALLSAFVCQEKENDNINIPTNTLKNSINSVKRIIENVKREEKRVKLENNLFGVNEVGFSIEMVEPVYKWANGASFAEICNKAGRFEGSIVRVMRRLDELLKQMAKAAACFGGEGLEEQMEAAAALIKRDIIFEASLYH